MKNILGKRAIAALVAGSLMTAGTVVAVPTVTIAAESATNPTESVTGDKPRGGGKSTGGTLTIAVTDVEAGDILHVEGSGFVKRPEGGELNVKLNDGGLKIPADVAGTSIVEVDKMGTGLLQNPNLPGDDGTFSFDVRLPADLVPGAYWVRVLAGADGGDHAATLAWFNVVEKKAEPTSTSSSQAPEPTSTSSSQAPEPTSTSSSQAPEPTSTSSSQAPEPTSTSSTPKPEPTPKKNGSSELKGKIPGSSELKGKVPGSSELKGKVPGSSELKDKVKGSSKGQNTKKLTSVLAAVGVLGALAALLGHLLRIGVIPAQVLPQALRDALHI